MRVTVAAALLAALVAAPLPAAATPEHGCQAVRPLDTTALRQALAGLPGAGENAALVRADGPDGCWQGAAGLADLTGRVPASVADRFRIGSVTKVFTAVVVLRLAAEGRLSLDGTVQRYLPGLLPPDYPEVRVRQLLNYTSGLPSPTLAHLSTIEGVVAHRFDRWTPQRYVTEALANPREFEPGTKQHYTNIGYVVAGLLVERVTGRTLEHEVRERLLAPLRLTGTSIPEREHSIAGPHLRGYQRMSDGRLLDVTEWDPSFGWATSSMVSTVRDLDVFLDALLRGRLLPPAQQAELFTVPAVDDVSGKPASYGAGLQRHVLPGVGEVWAKSGAWYGYLAGIGGTRDGVRRTTYGIGANDAKNGRDPSSLPARLAGAGLTLGARN